MRSFLKPFSRWSARILKHADSPMARGGLYMFSFLESIIIPLPTDPILMGCVIAARHKWLSICLFTALASVAGGAVGWILGAYLAPFVSDMLQLLPHQIASEEKFTSVSEAFNSIGIILVLSGPLTPLPYKVIAISAGLFGFGFSSLLTLLSNWTFHSLLSCRRDGSALSKPAYCHHLRQYFTSPYWCWYVYSPPHVGG